MPYLGSTLFVSMMVILVLATLAGAILLSFALFGPFVERASRACSERPKTSLLVGLPMTLFGFFVCAVALQAPGPGKAVGGLMTAVFLGVAILGLAGVSLSVGHALWARADADRPYRRVLRGAIVVQLASLMPVFGWLVLFPLMLSMGVGGAVLGLFSTRSVADWGHERRAA